MASRFKDSTNEDVRAFKDNKEYLNTRKSTNFINKDSNVLNFSVLGVFDTNKSKLTISVIVTHNIKR